MSEFPAYIGEGVLTNKSKKIKAAEKNVYFTKVNIIIQVWISTRVKKKVCLVSTKNFCIGCFFRARVFFRAIYLLSKQRLSLNVIQRNFLDWHKCGFSVHAMNFPIRFQSEFF